MVYKGICEYCDKETMLVVYCPLAEFGQEIEDICYDCIDKMENVC